MTKNYFIDGIKDSSIFGVSFIFLYLSIGANAFENSLSFLRVYPRHFLCFRHLCSFCLCRVIMMAIF